MLTWANMRARLHRVPGYGGDENRARRKEWIARALGYREQPRNLFEAFYRADAEQLQHVEAELERLERAGAEARP